MALSNAERQRRHRERQRAQRSGAALGSHFPLRDAINRIIIIEQSMMVSGEIGPREPTSLESSVTRLVEEAMEFCGGEELARALCALSGLPTDPWPGLRDRDIERMVLGREREAREARGLMWSTHDFNDEGADFHQRLVAELNRDWLESGESDDDFDERADRKQAEMRAALQNLFSRN